MFYLAIESSCDETSIAILSVKPSFDLVEDSFYTKLNSIKVIDSIISSQIETHAQYGGVVPEVGARMHAEQIHGLFQMVLNQALGKIKIDQETFYSQLETIFVTSEPGLMSALRVGIEFAKSLQFYISKQFNTQINLKFVNHLQGHVASSFYKFQSEQTLYNTYNPPLLTKQLPRQSATATPSKEGEFKISKLVLNLFFPDTQIFPHLHLMISGGNTQIRLLSSWADWQIVGQTIDDAAGECFDKTARMVGIPYPGGSTLSKIAGDQYSNPLNLPIAMLQSKDLNISLSGLKTAVRYKVEKAGIPNLTLDEPLTKEEIETLKTQSKFEDNPKLQFAKEICISTQFAIVEQIKRKIDLAINQYQPNSIGISGGVSANDTLINKIQELESVRVLQIPTVFRPDISLTGDNAVMIGLAGLMKVQKPHQLSS